MRRLTAAIVVALFAIGLSSTGALAAGKIDIGGRTNAVLVASLITAVPDGNGGTNSTLLIGSTLGYTTPSGRHEFAGGLFVVAAFEADLQVYSPVVEYRINTNLLGAEENILLYGGAVVGVAILSFANSTEVAGSFGPKIGAEYYVSSNVALQLEDRALWTSDGDFANSITLGIKVLF